MKNTSETSAQAPSTGLNISAKSFLAAIVILLALMITAYVLTFVIPGGEYARVEENGQELIVNGSYTPTEGGISLVKWLLSPFLVLGAAGNMTIIAVIVFLLVIGGIFHSLDKSGLMNYMLEKIGHRFRNSKYQMLALVSLFFMAMGAFVGSFEECVPMIPLAVALAISMGWDARIGMGMSLLAVGCGFASGVCNPFTVGVAQELVGLPMFSGMSLRLISFVLIYGLLMGFLVYHAKKLDKAAAFSSATTLATGSAVDNKVSVSSAASSADSTSSTQDSSVFKSNALLDKGLIVFASILGAGILMILCSAFVPFLQGILMPLIAVIFLAAGVSSCLVCGMKKKELGKNFIDGATSIFPAVLLILMASSIKYTLAEAKILDTILYYLTGLITELPSGVSILFVYLCTLVMNFFIPSGSAKAFLLMPLMAPLSDLCGFSRQLAVVAYAFGDGFSNLFYCTNPVLLIGLGLSGISYGKWVKWSLPFQLMVLAVTCAMLLVGAAVGY
ncbi:MAG: YfcC family protein [Lachnospiraceae bacterium]|nr:YfcC family protein [Lachnospiraceae bacterium]